MDVEDIAPGQRFAQAIADTMAASDTVLVVIGPRWAEILRQRAQEQRRDYVREEIEAALARHVTTVPVLVGGAGMEQLSGLPDTLAALAQYEAAELRDSSFSEDCTRLAKALRLGTAGPGKPSRNAWILAAAAPVVLLAVSFMVIGPCREYRARKAALPLPKPPVVDARPPESSSQIRPDDTRTTESPSIDSGTQSRPTTSQAQGHVTVHHTQSPSTASAPSQPVAEVVPAEEPRLVDNLAIGRRQSERGEYRSAFKTYGEVLKSEPQNRAAMDVQTDAAMRWLENLHALSNDKGEDLAGALDQMISVLDAAEVRNEGRQQRTADILAHRGWAHWLNQRLVQREFGPLAERDLREALRIDPTNVFANAMMGNWMLQNHGNTKEALQYLRAAAAQNKERLLVREMQLGVLVNPRDAEERSELIRIANDMRRNGESLDAGRQHRILNTYDPNVNTATELQQTLSAVPPDDAWATYLWLDDQTLDGYEGEQQRIRHDFIHAAILELEGKRQEALADFQKLQRALKQRGITGRIATHVDAAITRLTSR